MHKTLYFFPNFSRNDAIFPNSKGPGPIPKKGCESPESTLKVDFWSFNCIIILLMFCRNYPKTLVTKKLITVTKTYKVKSIK